MGQALRGNRDHGGAGWRSAFVRRLVATLGAASFAVVPFTVKVASAQSVGVREQESLRTSAAVRLDAGRFTVVSEAHDSRLARSLLAAAQRNDSFPGLARPTAHVLVAIAPDAARFREWVGPGTPEWGAAIAIPAQQRIVMQGSSAGSDAGDPLVVLRHELAHLALHEAMGDIVPRWFDEGYASYAANEWSREQTFETASALIWRTMPGVDSLDAGFYHGESDATWSYALAHRVVAELAALDAQHGLANFLAYWKQSGDFERALRSAYGLTGERFDQYWHARTRRQYGALALVANLSLTFGFFGVLLGPLFVSRWRRDRRRLADMKRAEAVAEARARESALEALLLAGAQGEDSVSSAAITELQEQPRFRD